MLARYAWGIVTLWSLGCASASTRGPAADPGIERVGVSGAPSLPIDVDRNPSRHRIGVSRANSWTVLAEVFDSLNIQLEFADLRNFRAGNTRFIAPHQIAGQLKSAYLRCGTAPGGPLADSHRVTMSVITELRPIGTDSTDVFTQVVASARASDGTSTNAVICATTGALERAVTDLVGRRVQARAKGSSLQGEGEGKGKE